MIGEEEGSINNRIGLIGGQCIDRSRTPRVSDVASYSKGTLLTM